MPHFDLVALIKAIGYIGVAVIVFAESGLLIGFFLPGDSLLFTAGFLASQEYLSIWILAPLAFVAAVLGDAVGYGFGRRVGRGLFQRPESTFFKPEYLARAESFFQRHGGKALVLARFLPIVRTFTPIVAGAAEMRYARFALYNILGGFLWAVGVSVAGYFLGSAIPNIDRYLLPIIVMIIAISVAPTAIHVWRENREEITLIVRKRFRRSETRR
ncbi:MAG TPA: VTT domain-containing protein [Nitrolancea sp.]|jgi:membrane-associated protein|nr:VTT domain-containing protein [Nitrolancea sp.]